MKNILLILHNQKTVTLYIDPNISIHALKHIIENEYFIPVKYQQLYTNGLLLHDSVLVTDIESDIFTVCYHISGGGCRYKKAKSKFRWKWKKKRIRRRQGKHRKMRLRAR